jgi:hypothetical protein
MKIHLSIVARRKQVQFQKSYRGFESYFSALTFFCHQNREKRANGRKMESIERASIALDVEHPYTMLEKQISVD